LWLTKERYKKAGREMIIEDNEDNVDAGTQPNEDEDDLLGDAIYDEYEDVEGEGQEVNKDGEEAIADDDVGDKEVDGDDDVDGEEVRADDREFSFNASLRFQSTPARKRWRRTRTTDDSLAEMERNLM
jgi:hypothetical protein